jgi:hypothetical protein
MTSVGMTGVGMTRQWSVWRDRALEVLAAGALAVSGFIHAQLYVDGYRFLHVVGVLFLLQAAASFALTALLLAGLLARTPVWIHLGAAGAALGALGGFAASRTVGVFGFIEYGLQPAPQALLSIMAEIIAALALGVVLLSRARAAR